MLRDMLHQLGLSFSQEIQLGSITKIADPTAGHRLRVQHVLSIQKHVITVNWKGLVCYLRSVHDLDRLNPNYSVHQE